MSRGHAMGVVFVLFTLSACASILGIDDGIPRDASTADVTTTQDASDAASDVQPVDAPVDVPPDIPFVPIVCGDASCNGKIEFCCRQGDPTDASTQTFSCLNDAALCGNGLIAECDDPSSCAELGHDADVCCGVVPEGGTIVNAIRCKTKAACGGGALLCRPGDDEVCDLEAGKTCQPSISSALGFDICK